MKSFLGVISGAYREFPPGVSNICIGNVNFRAGGANFGLGINIFSLKLNIRSRILILIIVLPLSCIFSISQRVLIFTLVDILATALDTLASQILTVRSPDAVASISGSEGCQTSWSTESPCPR